MPLTVSATLERIKSDWSKPSNKSALRLVTRKVLSTVKGDVDPDRPPLKAGRVSNVIVPVTEAFVSTRLLLIVVVALVIINCCVVALSSIPRVLLKLNGDLRSVTPVILLPSVVTSHNGILSRVNDVLLCVTKLLLVLISM